MSALDKLDGIRSGMFRRLTDEDKTALVDLIHELEVREALLTRAQADLAAQTAQIPQLTERLANAEAGLRDALEWKDRELDRARRMEAVPGRIAAHVLSLKPSAYRTGDKMVAFLDALAVTIRSTDWGVR